MCNQTFCQFCVTRQPRAEESQSSSRSSSSSSERICTTCKSICAPEINADDLLKLKLKHLRSVLTRANIPTNTCKEKRDLVDLMLRNKDTFRKYYRPPTQPTPQPNAQSNTSQSQTQSTFNNTVNSIINNVQDFVSFNLNSVLNPGPVPCPAPPNRTDNRQNQTHYNTSSSSTSSTSSNNNLGSMLNNLFGDQLPNVINNTFSQFTFNQEPSEPVRTEPQVVPNETEVNQPREPTPPTQPQPTQETKVKRRASISDLNSEADIENLSIKQIKEILVTNFVEYKGCCERKELVDKLRRLYHSHQENKRLEQEINGSTNGASGVSGGAGGSVLNDESSSAAKKGVDESDVCKICMESIIDCVLLECGHMCSCIKCGKQLAECPICRQNVVRVLRVFKS